MNYTLITDHITQRIKLTKAQIEFFLSLLEFKRIRKKEYLLRTGETCRYDFFVNAGCLKVCYIDEKGNENIIKFAIENQWVVDLESFLYEKPSFFYLQAIEETEVFCITKKNYELLHKKIPAFEKFSNERWQNGFIALQQRIMQNLSLTAEERFHHFKIKYPNLDQRIPQKLIASYLGITPEFLSMLRKQWVKKS